jgi:hypothetical protein
MDNRLRRVSTLRLRSRDESLIRRGAILIEDALRTASLPDADGGRLWVVRKLALGRIRAGDPPSSIALRIEARFRESGAFAVHAESPHAAAADVVYFDDDVEPYTALALRIARGRPPVAWFWPLAARGWTPVLSHDDSMRVLLAGALASSAGPVAALALIRALVRNAEFDSLATALRFQDGPPLLRSFGWTIPQPSLPAAAAPPSPPRPPDSPSPALERMAAPWFDSWGPTDARSLWLACAFYAIERPAFAAQSSVPAGAGAAADSSLPAKAAAWIAFVVERTVSPSTSGAQPTATPSSVVQRMAPPPVPSGPRALPPVSDAGQAFSSSLPDAPLSEAPPFPAAVRTPVPASQRPARAHLFTTRAGLFFLIPAMQRLGMHRWHEENPQLAQWSIPCLVLRAIAERLETLPDDPALAALGELPADPPPGVLAAVNGWERRLRQFSRRIPRIGLHSLICRPGRIVFTETHIDVLFRLDRADIRIRRAGLDIDPGWTPWLGRVIHFHYLADGAYDA